MIIMATKTTAKKETKKTTAAKKASTTKKVAAKKTTTTKKAAPAKKTPAKKETTKKDKKKKEMCNDLGIKLLYYSDLNIEYPYFVYHFQNDQCIYLHFSKSFLLLLPLGHLSILQNNCFH